MYRYDEFDEAFVRQRVLQFKEQVERRISGALTEDEFKPLRLQNGLYLQLHAYMLRVAVPYGTLNSQQLDQLATIADRWDRGYGHLTTRQNIQFNWPRLRDVPHILDALADVGMHAIQTSGNCIRNVTADHFAGAAKDEVEDPRLTAELIRQWSTDHPEFAYLPRKFKIAVTGCDQDRAVIRAHDIGLQLVRDSQGNTAYDIYVGGGLGRTPIVGQLLRASVSAQKLFSYLEAILRVFNRAGRRDNKYKARIKILVKDQGLDVFSANVDAEYDKLTQASSVDQFTLAPGVVSRIKAYFSEPAWITESKNVSQHNNRRVTDSAYARWSKHNLSEHKQANYQIVTVSIKKPGDAPGDVSANQMRAVAELAREFGHDEIRISHEQNFVLPHVHQSDLPTVYDRLIKAGLGTANVGLVSDIIACPGMDYCALATARSIPIAQDIATHFADAEHADRIGPLKIKISGCINACAHHHIGHIGILGLEKGGRENYQITLGGDHTESLRLGDRAGPGIDAEEVVPAMERIVDTYLNRRESDDETFLDTYQRVGAQPFKQALYDRPSNTSE